MRKHGLKRGNAEFVFVLSDMRKKVMPRDVIIFIKANDRDIIRDIQVQTPQNLTNHQREFVLHAENGGVLTGLQHILQIFHIVWGRLNVTIVFYIAKRTVHIRVLNAIITNASVPLAERKCVFLGGNNQNLSVIEPI